MALYLDSSALVKLFVNEAGSDDVEKEVNKETKLYLGWLTPHEMLSALSRRLRTGVNCLCRRWVICELSCKTYLRPLPSWFHIVTVSRVGPSTCCRRTARTGYVPLMPSSSRQPLR